MSYTRLNQQYEGFDILADRSNGTSYTLAIPASRGNTPFALVISYSGAWWCRFPSGSTTLLPMTSNTALSSVSRNGANNTATFNFSDTQWGGLTVLWFY